MTGAWGREVVAVVAVVAVLVAAPGCSVLFVQGPPPDDRPPEDGLRCTTNRTAPVLDTIFTANDLASVAYVAGKDDVPDKAALIAIEVAVASMYALSAAYGYRATSACQEWRSQHRDVFMSPSWRARTQWRTRPTPPPPADSPAPSARPAEPSGAASDTAAEPAPPPPTPSTPTVPQQQDDDVPGRRRPRRAPPAVPPPDTRFGG